MAIATGQRRAAVPVTAVGRDVATVGTGFIRIELRNLAARDHDIQSAVVVCRQVARNRRAGTMAVVAVGRRRGADIGIVGVMDRVLIAGRRVAGEAGTFPVNGTKDPKY